MLHGLFVAIATLLGAAFGSFAQATAVRTATGVSLLRESRCDACDAPLRPHENVPVVSWLVLRGRCAHCGTGIPVRTVVVEVLGALAFALLALWLLPQEPDAGAAWLPTAIALGFLAAVSIVLTLVDLDTGRLPDVIVLPSIAIGAMLLTVAALVAGTPGRLLQAAAGAAILGGGYLVIRLVRPDGMGGGDVKLAVLLGLYLGYAGWGALAVGSFAAFVWAALYALLARRRGAIAFGPWMILGAWTGVVAGEQLWDAYRRLWEG
ncbi:prepilin peptidase [Microbacterium sp. No. 7]|uniref:prepilin peptidase n=1 Tax=Microbacterium sp. No. 7 TaxID=1714373 RepID=UPI0006D1DCC8|nr:A24 family peptidase [Microbacterium sp. No. 7]ALJ18743.1 hypothetical protein AOA12_01965 [Microbacterium sp. No. 7]